MPRALLLKKPRFNDDCEPSNVQVSIADAGSDIRNMAVKSNDEEDRIPRSPAMGPKKCHANDPKNGKQHAKYKMLRKPKTAKKNSLAAKHPVKSGAKRHIDAPDEMDHSDEDDMIPAEDDGSDRLTLQHFVKWMRKDGKTFKIWECGMCHKEFMHQYTLMRHLPIHTNERSFKCNVCFKSFRQASTLCRHKAIHSDARPFHCSSCGKAFNRSSTLIAHRKTHSESKPHVCHVCGKGFHQKGNLKNHVYTHTGERPYRCDKCDRGFNQMSNLMCHKAHAHVEKPKHICQLCDKEFPCKFSLRTHEEYKHGIKYDITGEQAIDTEFQKNKLSVDALKRGRPTNGNNSKTITLPNGDKTIKFVENILRHEAVMNSKESNICLLDTTEEIAITDPVDESQVLTDIVSLVQSPEQEMAKEIPSSVDTILSKTTGILIDPITTSAMILAQERGQMAFALLKPAKGIPVLVKILPTLDGKQVLVPATAEDLRNAGKITVSPSLGQANGSTIKAVQIKVPVVATVFQKLSATGDLVIEIEEVDNIADGLEEIMEHSVQQVLQCASAEVAAALDQNSDPNIPEISLDASDTVPISCANSVDVFSTENAHLDTLPHPTLVKTTDNENAINTDLTTTTEIVQTALENVVELNMLS